MQKTIAHGELKTPVSEQEPKDAGQTLTNRSGGIKA